MVLVDTSVWIEYFRGNEQVKNLNDLIDSNTLAINDLILTELLPFIIQKKENKLKKLLLNLDRIKMNIDWNGLIQMQTLNLQNGINKVGIPDLIIAQNAIQTNLHLYSLDKHFKLMSSLFGLKLIHK
ncbi:MULTISPECIES: PIN domain-containing protein [Treponema]|jgi:PIN domain protein|uniref:PIN domain protein n=2 Tax=Treponema denticola TaxID=158 RepID=Q73R94_TREDE|nr:MULTISPECIES: PIN domain-containing protein [Treponema]AAS10694.1 PIN domain protein [Treponema denticola ATCC 35405]EMB25284.1 hypothetical protein HMPREF9724_00904 [Treponema denticola SP37]EMB33253.1 hypothetical protein HMPREF9726_01614 [Treponema denticola H-22]EPF34341.1 hypothetical protein HMPREF9734_00894 [Treponema denticola SP44]EPF38998.1 hypothetical protein HMPREF9731_01761 [Treponema denticola SP23]